MKKASLTIKFMGLCALVQDQASNHEVKAVTVLLPATDVLDKRLCEHRPRLVFRQSQLAQPLSRDMPDNDGFADFEGTAFGIWDLLNLELSITTTPASASAPLQLAKRYDHLLHFDQFTSGLGRIQPDFLDSSKWAGRVLASVKLTSGKLDSLKLTGGPALDYGIAPIGTKPTFKTPFRQVACYEFFGSADGVVTIVGKPIDGEPAKVLRLVDGAEIAITHLCAAGKPDENADIAEDVLAFYEMSMLPVPIPQRRVLQRVPNQTGGNPVTPRQDACPPARAYAA